MSNKNKNLSGVVYSTDQDFQYQENQEQDVETLPNNRQTLYVSLDKKQRNGKKVTLISNFVGKEEDLINLSKVLKTKCCVGGTAKEDYILIQGDFRDKIIEILQQAGYKTKRIGG